MRRYFEFVVLTMFLGCGTPAKKNVEEKPVNYLEKLANVHGFENWK